MFAPPLRPPDFMGSASGINDNSLFRRTECPAETGQCVLDEPRFEGHACRLDRDMYASVLFFAATNLMKAPAFLALGQLSVSQLNFFPLAMASSWLGVRLVRTIDVRKFNFTITLILLCVSVALVSQGIAGFQES